MCYIYVSTSQQQKAYAWFLQCHMYHSCVFLVFLFFLAALGSADAFGFSMVLGLAFDGFGLLPFGNEDLGLTFFGLSLVFVASPAFTSVFGASLSFTVGVEGLVSSGHVWNTDTSFTLCPCSSAG